MTDPQHVSPRPHGMTLVEVLAVVVILGLLTTVVTVSLRGSVGKAKREIARTNIALIVQAVERYALETGTLPATEDGLRVLADPPAGHGEAYLTTDKLVDPWGNPYVYMRPGRASAYAVLCYGADGQVGGQRGTEAEDLSSEDLSGKGGSIDAQ